MALRYISQDPYGYSDHPKVRILSFNKQIFFFSVTRLARKVSGWQSLRSLAASGGASLNLDFVSRLVQTQGVRLESYLVVHVLLIVFPQVLVIGKHFIPPLLVNASLGTVLWAVYSESSSALSSYDGLGARPITIAAISGAVAGGAQAVVAAPAENVRLAIERGTGRGWSHAWKEVLRGTAPIQPTDSASLRELRQVRSWVMDVRSMAGRGWNGWGWGLAKDVCGEFAVVSQCGRFQLILCFLKDFLYFSRSLRSLVMWPKI